MSCEDCAAMRRQIAIAENARQEAEAQAQHHLRVHVRKEEANDKLRAKIEELQAEVASLKAWLPTVYVEAGHARIPVEPECTGSLVHDEFTPCPRHDKR